MSHEPYVLPKVELRGKPFEMGLQYGQIALERIRLHVMNQKLGMARLDPQNPEWWRAELHSYLPAYEDLAPHFMEEMQGLARGSGLPQEDVWLINLRDDLYASRTTGIPGACTSFGCSGQVTLSGQPILGQTKDTGAISRDLYVVLALYQQGRPDILELAYAGEFGVLGMSSSGMAIMGNSVSVKARPQGNLPASLFRRLALESDSVDDLLELVGRRAPNCPGSSTIGDRHGRIIALERASSGWAAVEAVDGMLAHANHIRSRELLADESYPEPARSISQHRERRLSEQLAAERGRLTPELAMRCLMDHDGYPHSICFHPATADALQTTAAFVVEPTLGRLHAVRGQPCQAWPVTYTL